MSIINDIVMKNIHDYDMAKIGKWLKKEVPPENTFFESDLYIIGRNIVSELEGILADKFIGK